jgi:signal transduction histidine kinase
MTLDHYESRLQESEKTIRILQKQLQRSEKERQQMESDIATKEFLLKNVIDELQISQQTLEKRSQDLQFALEKMQTMQLQLIHSEKMSALGQTVAGIAHEINNPISFIYGNLFYLRQYMEDVLDLVGLYHQHFPSPPIEILSKREEIDTALIEEDVPKVLHSMNTGTQRIRDIILALRNFSRLDEVGYKAVDLHQGIENTLMILQSRIDQIQVVKQYSELPPVMCAADGVNQVFLNILNNAIDAINQRKAHQTDQTYTGLISIQTSFQPNQKTAISISDNGSGMSDEIVNKIFDPFFTTKEVGKGTVLGLAVAHQIIVEKHGGEIEVDSVIDQGSTFIIYLPIQGLT